MDIQVSAVSTSKEMEIFNHKQFGNVRVILDKDNNPWFVAKDVCQALEYRSTNIPTICASVPNEWVDSKPIAIRSENGVIQARKVLFLSEQGLYFFVARSDKPKALPFQKWLAGEVLPSIRKTGSYSVKQVVEQVSKEISIRDMRHIKGVLEGLHSALKSSETAIKALTHELEEKEVQIEVLEKDKRSEQKRAHTVMGKLGATTRDRNKFERKATKSERRIDALESDNTKLKSSNTKLKLKLHMAKEEIELITEMKDTWKNRAYKMRNRYNESLDRSLGLDNETTSEISCTLH